MTTQHDEDTAELVVVGYQTAMDGLVLRWYHTLDDAHQHRAVCSASRNGVLIGQNGWVPYLHQVPDRALHDARQAWQWLAAGEIDQARTLQTHQVTGLAGGRVEPVKREREG